MVDVLFICTGNIARSPLAAQLLRARLAAPQISVSSAGTHALTGQRMAPLALDVAQRWALPATDAHAHRARRHPRARHFFAISPLMSVQWSCGPRAQRGLYTRARALH